MTELEVVRLFKNITRAYPNFDTEPDNVPFWKKYLANTSSEVAEMNLDRHILSGNRFPPTVAEIVRPLEPAREAHSIYHEQLKGAAQAHLADLESWREKAVPPPAHIKERMRQLAER